MARRWFVRSSDNALTAMSDDSSLVAPSGTTAVSQATIKSTYSGKIYIGGTWDGTTYTPPTGHAPRDDPATDGGKVRAAARNFLEQFGNWSHALNQEAPGHLVAYQSLGQNLLLGGRKAGYINLRNSAVDADARVTWANGMARGASTIVSAFTFYKAAEGLTIPSSYTPGDPLSWRTLSDGSAITLQAAINSAAADFRNPPDFSDIELLSEDWINLITA